MAEIYTPGDKVPASGIYLAVHNKEHAKQHEINFEFLFSVYYLTSFTHPKTVCSKPVYWLLFILRATL